MALVEINDGDGCLIYQALEQLSQDCAKVAKDTDDGIERIVFQRLRTSGTTLPRGSTRHWTSLTRTPERW